MRLKRKLEERDLDNDAYEYQKEFAELNGIHWPPWEHSVIRGIALASWRSKSASPTGPVQAKTPPTSAISSTEKHSIVSTDSITTVPPPANPPIIERKGTGAHRAGKATSSRQSSVKKKSGSPAQARPQGSMPVTVFPVMSLGHGTLPRPQASPQSTQSITAVKSKSGRSKSKVGQPSPASNAPNLAQILAQQRQKNPYPMHAPGASLGTVRHSTVPAQMTMTGIPLHGRPPQQSLVNMGDRLGFAYFKERRAGHVRAQYPQYSFAEIENMLAHLWNNLSESERQNLNQTAFRLAVGRSM